MNSENRKYHSRSKPSKKRTSFQDRTVPEKRTDLQDRKASKKRADLQDRKALKKQELTQKKTQPALPGSCPAAGKCGGCDLQGVPYEKQLERKDRQLNQLLAGLAEERYPISPFAPIDVPCLNSASSPAFFVLAIQIGSFRLMRNGDNLYGSPVISFGHLVGMSPLLEGDQQTALLASLVLYVLPSPWQQYSLTARRLTDRCLRSGLK